MPPNAASTRPRVLVVEDDVDQCTSLCRYLERRGLEAECAGTLAEAISCVRSVHYACVVLDLGLPDSDSAMTVSRLGEFDDVPVIVCTGHDDRHLLQEAIGMGAGFAIKPCPVEALMEKVLRRVQETRPDLDMGEEILEEQRALTHRVEEGDKPMLVKWAPVISICLALAIASCTLGAWLYHSVAGDAAERQRNQQRLELMEKSLSEFRMAIERNNQVQTDLGIKAQTSIEDRSSLHREIGSLGQQQKELKEDVVRRLERIEDSQQTLLKELSRVPK